MRRCSPYLEVVGELELQEAEFLGAVGGVVGGRRRRRRRAGDVRVDAVEDGVERGGGARRVGPRQQHAPARPARPRPHRRPGAGPRSRGGGSGRPVVGRAVGGREGSGDPARHRRRPRLLVVRRSRDATLPTSHADTRTGLGPRRPSGYLYLLFTNRVPP